MRINRMPIEHTYKYLGHRYYSSCTSSECGPEVCGGGPWFALHILQKFKHKCSCRTVCHLYGFRCRCVALPCWMQCSPKVGSRSRSRSGWKVVSPVGSLSHLLRLLLVLIAARAVAMWRWTHVAQTVRGMAPKTVPPPMALQVVLAEASLAMVGWQQVHHHWPLLPRNQHSHHLRQCHHINVMATAGSSRQQGTASSSMGGHSSTL